MSAAGQAPLAYVNGQWVEFSQAAVPVTDAGFVLGTTVAEQLRTFAGKLFRLDDHLARLADSLRIVGVDLGSRFTELPAIAARLVEQNHKLLAEGDDLGLTIFITPGPYGTYAHVASQKGPIIGMHTQPLPFGSWAARYESGQALSVARTRQVPVACWPAELKCRSRMHYWLADHEAEAFDPGSRALLLDTEGFVAEASTASVFIYQRDEGLIAPPAEKVLPGISLKMIEQLAQKLGLPFIHRELTLIEVKSADEVLLCSTSPCVLPVTRLDKHPIADGRPGEVYRRLLKAWGEAVGLNIAEQARKFARR